MAQNKAARVVALNVNYRIHNLSEIRRGCCFVNTTLQPSSVFIIETVGNVVCIRGMLSAVYSVSIFIVKF